MEFKERLIQQYSSIFEKPVDETTIGSGFADKWGWYTSVYVVASGDLKNYEWATQQNIHKFLTFLEFKEDLAIEEKKSLNKITAK